MKIETTKASEVANRVAETLMGKTEERLAKGIFQLPDGIYVRCETYKSKTWLRNRGIRISIGFDRYVGCEKYMRLVYLKVIGDDNTVRFDADKLLKKVAEVEVMVIARKKSLAAQAALLEERLQKFRDVLPTLKVAQAYDDTADVIVHGSDRFDYRRNDVHVYGFIETDPCSITVEMECRVPLSELEGFIERLQVMSDE